MIHADSFGCLFSNLSKTSDEAFLPLPPSIPLSLSSSSLSSSSLPSHPHPSLSLIFLPPSISPFSTLFLLLSLALSLCPSVPLPACLPLSFSSPSLRHFLHCSFSLSPLLHSSLSPSLPLADRHNEPHCHLQPYGDPYRSHSYAIINQHFRTFCPFSPCSCLTQQKQFYTSWCFDLSWSGQVQESSSL